MKKIPVVLLLTMLLTLCLFGEENSNRVTGPTLQKPTETSDIWLDVNRLSGVFRNNGIWHYDVVEATQGTEWPKGSGNSPIFAGGQWIAASVNGEIKVAGIQHSATEFQAGAVLSPGVADNPKDPKYKWYELRSSGNDDRTRWPYDQGAPVDANGDPLLLGDQTMYSIWNDLADHAEYGTNKLSVEVHQTAWAYNRADALGDMHFIKWRMVNKSGEYWDSTYFSIWLDPDLGDAADDLVGCDTTLGLGFTYNANNADQTYGTPPPAQGIDFFQGPIVDEVGSTVTLPNGTVLQDKTMRKMTSFVYYDNNDSNRGNPTDGGDVWGYMTGFWRDDSPITFGDRGDNPVGPAHPATSFMFPGDPETEQGTGWLDYAEDDRRFLMTTGPFPMPAWVDENGNGIPDFGEPGVQDVVAGVILAKGDDNLNSVTKLKEVDGLAQLAYDLDFNLSVAPKPPVVTASATSNEVVLTWDETSEFNDDGSPYLSEDPIVVAALGDTVIIDNVVQVIDDADYNFYGYSVYQYADAAQANPVLLEHWDIGPIAHAEPYTAQRFAKMTVNKNPAVGNSGSPLVNGKEYYFGVVAEAYLAFGAPKVFTSPATVITVIPNATPGVTGYSSSYGDSIEVIHSSTADTSDGSVVVWVVDPSKTTGLGYSVSFNADLTWNLVNSLGDTITKNQSNQTGNDAYNVYDGLMIKVQGPDPGINTSIPGPFGDIAGYNGWDYNGADRWLSWPVDWGGDTFGGHIFNGFSFFGSELGAADYFDMEIRIAGDTQANDPDRWSTGYIYRRDTGYSFAGTGPIPMAAYEQSTGRRLNICFVEMDGMPSINDPNTLIPANGVWDMGWHEFPNDTGFAESGGREYVFWMASDYDPTGAVYDDNNWGPAADVLYAMWPGERGSRPYLMGPWELFLFSSKVNSEADVYTFTAPAAGVATTASIKEDMKKIKVVPNPYYGSHSGELDPFNRWVQFTYLPPTCTIRIFDLAGNLIRKLEKNDPSTPFMQWNMKNEYELPVASGIYVFHVDAEGIGEKIGKIAIFTPNERLDTW